MSSVNLRKLLLPLALAAAFSATAVPAGAAVFVQCPGDTNGDAVPDAPGDPNVVCKHLTAGDGFAAMADGRVLYTFGFSDVTGVLPDQAIGAGILAANYPAPIIELQEGNKFYLTLTNVGMAMRPDLFDPHSVHFHGFPNQAPVFDGMPDGSFGVNMGSSLTYFYNVTEPGTYIYHCHVEAAEHMQMGMLGQIYVRPAQDGSLRTYNGRDYTRFAYNDGDGSTGYNKSYALQLSSFDHVFHEEHLGIQPLPFANMKDTYAMINGRGYPDTANPASLPAPAENGGIESQKTSALIQLNRATEGEKLLLRFSNVSITSYFTVGALGLPMRVVGAGAHIARGPGGKDIYYDTASVTLGGGETADVIIDTAGVPAGTYFLYTTNLNYLSNNDQDFGGMMTEIVIQ
ncbi:MAG: multicopper oxidase domain-containing protein [Nitrosomonadales bacterium]|nr:multicopper oxidase domain-containing protein [Nitrosomonadales bacterium]